MIEIAILYHSESGNTADVATCIRDGALEIEGVSAALMPLDDIDEDLVTRADAVIVGFPTYAGSCSWQIKRWVDTTKLKLAGKIGAVFATENYLGGGADVAELRPILPLVVQHEIMVRSRRLSWNPRQDLELDFAEMRPVRRH